MSKPTNCEKYKQSNPDAECECQDCKNNPTKEELDRAIAYMKDHPETYPLKSLPNQNNQDWKEKFRDRFINDMSWINKLPLGIELEDFIEQTIHQEVEKEVGKERQFILNVLDGIDIAEKEHGFAPTSTRSIRFALQSRPVNLQPTNNTKEDE